MRSGRKETGAVQRPISSHRSVSEVRITSANPSEIKRNSTSHHGCPRVCDGELAEGKGLESTFSTCKSLILLGSNLRTFRTPCAHPDGRKSVVGQLKRGDLSGTWAGIRCLANSMPKGSLATTKSPLYVAGRRHQSDAPSFDVEVHVVTTIFPPAAFPSIVRCASTI